MALHGVKPTAETKTSGRAYQIHSEGQLVAQRWWGWGRILSGTIMEEGEGEVRSEEMQGDDRGKERATDGVRVNVDWTISLLELACSVTHSSHCEHLPQSATARNFRIADPQVNALHMQALTVCS